MILVQRYTCISFVLIYAILWFVGGVVEQSWDGITRHLNRILTLGYKLIIEENPIIDSDVQDNFEAVNICNYLLNL